MNTQRKLKPKYGNYVQPVAEITTVTVRPENRITSSVMTMFEYARVVGIRAKQISDTNITFAKNAAHLTSPEDIAKQEILEKECPLSIFRTLQHYNPLDPTSKNIVEEWEVNEMSPPINMMQ